MPPKKATVTSVDGNIFDGSDDSDSCSADEVSQGYQATSSSDDDGKTFQDIELEIYKVKKLVRRHQVN